MRQVRITRQRRTADARWRRRREAVLPLDPRDPDITRAKRRQRDVATDEQRLRRDHRRGCRQRARVALDLAGCRRWPRGPCAAGRGVRDSASGGADRRAAAGGRVAAAGLRSAVASQGDGAAAAFVVVASAGLVARGAVQRIPRSALQLLVGTLLSSFGTFWAVEGLGVAWPGSDAAILVLVGW